MSSDIPVDVCPFCDCPFTAIIGMRKVICLNAACGAQGPSALSDNEDIALTLWNMAPRRARPAMEYAGKRKGGIEQ